MKSIQRVIVLTNTLKAGGAEKQSIMLANALQNDYPTYLIVYYDNGFDQRLKHLTEKYNISVLWLIGSHLKKLFYLYKLFKREKNTVVFSYLATTNFINAIIGKIAGIKFRVGGIRNAKLDRSKFYIQRILHNYFLTCSVFNNYQGEKDLCSSGFNEKKAIIIPNCHEISRPILDNKTIKGVLNIITIGRFVDQKDYFTSLDAIRLLKDKLTESNSEVIIKYTIVGYGKIEYEIRNYVHKQKLDEIVDILINPLNAINYLEDAHIYLSTSLFEGLSNSIMEAMEYSLPIVATNVGDNSKLVIEGETGFLANVQDARAIAEKLQILIENNELRNIMGQNGYIHLAKDFSLSKFKSNYIDLISKLNNNE